MALSSAEAITPASDHDPAGAAQGPAPNDKPNAEATLSQYPAGRCLRPLLDALGWRGEERHLIESLPHFDTVDDMDALRSILARLNYETKPQTLRLCDLTDDVLPCVFAVSRDRLLVVGERDEDRLLVFDSNTSAQEWCDAEAISGTAYLISEVDIDRERLSAAKHGWVLVMVARFKMLLWQLLGISFITNVFALAVPIYTMNVYDKVIGTRSQDSLVYFCAGILIIVLADVALRTIRARATAYLGTRCEAILGSAAFQQLLYMPINMTERAPIGAQITRIKQFEGIRDIFTGTIANTVLDLPFMVIFLIAIIFIGGNVAWVPVALIAAYGIMAALTIPLTKHHVSVTGEARAKQQNYFIEMISQHRCIRDNGAESIWMQRFRQLCGESVIRHFRSQQLNIMIQTLSQSMVTLSGVATLWIATLLVMAGELSLGALIAVMALVWRILAPINSAFLSLNRLSQVAQTFKQINALLRLDLERVPGKVPSFYRKFDGEISVSRLGFRYLPRSEPALAGVTLEVPAGQLVVVAGHSGAGKSTLLKIIFGLYPPQAGAVHVDGLDVRQLDPGELRHAISYVPQKITFFHGTLEQNIRLAHPTASDEDIERACREARVYDYAELLPDGAGTRLNAELQRKMPDALRQRVLLARAFVKDAPIMLLDEPADGLDQSGEEGLLDKIESLRGKATIIMVSHRPSHMRMADRVIFMEHGQIVHDGKPDQVVPLILGSQSLR